MADSVSPPAAPPPSVFSLVFREPETFIHRWHREGQPYSGGVFAGLALLAIVGTLAYGAVLGIAAPNPTDLDSAQRILRAAGLYCLAAAVSWAVPLPAVYILNAMSGSNLRASTLFLAALVTAAWGGMALLAFLPVTLTYILAFPGVGWLALTAHLAVFTLVGVSMATVFGRQVERLEPGRGGGRVWWLFLFVLLKLQLMYTFDLITFRLT